MYKIYEMYEMYKKYETDERYLSQYGFHNGARSRQLAGDLSPWCKERRGAYIGSLTPLKIEQHLIPTSLSSNTFDSRWPCSVEALPVTSNGFHPQWLALQATAARGAYGRVVVNNAQSVINDTSTITTWVKGCQSSTIRVQKCPVWSMTGVVAI